jgi:hypothetical protein
MIVTSWKNTALLLAIICFLYTPVMAQEPNDFEQLTLEIATEKREVLPMEPIPITITLSNDTAKGITGHPLIEPGAGFLSIYVAAGDQPFRRFPTADWPLLSFGNETRILEHGFQRSVSGYVFYAHPANLDKERHGQYLFESPGTYRIKAILKDLKGQEQIESNILSIKVKQPTGKDAAAYEFLKNLRNEQDKDVYYGNFLLTSFGRSIIPRTQKVLDKKEEFISQFPNCRYARYIYYSLGDNYCLGVGKGVEHGITLLEKAAGYKDFFLAEEAMLKLIEVLSRQDEPKKAGKYKVIFARRFPKSEEGSDYIEEMYTSPAYWWSFIWPWLLILVCVLVGLFLFRLVPQLKKRQG